MTPEYRNPDGTLSQGYFCPICGKTSNMVGTGHGLGACRPNPELVAKLVEANKIGKK